MPTYEYQCRACGHRFERFQSITAGTTLACPRCRKRARRMISPGGGFLFKGDGFYITDYRSAGYKKQAKEEASSKSSQAKASGSHAKEKKGT